MQTTYFPQHRPPIRCAMAGSLILLLAQSHPLSAEPTRQLTTPRATTEPGESWLMRELRTFLSYPHLERAQRLITTKQYPAARHELETYLQRSPHDQAVRQMLVVLLYELKDYPAVEREAASILRATPDNGPALLYRGLARSASEQGKLAVDDLIQAGTASDVSADQRQYALSLAAEWLDRQGQPARALEQLQRLIQLRDDYDVRMRIAKSMADQRQFGPAAEQASWAHARATTASQKRAALDLEAECARQNDDHGRARAALLAALELSPADPDLLRALGYLAHADRQLDQAAHYFNQLVAVDASALNRKLLGQTLYQLGRYSLAIAQFDAIALESLAPAERFETLSTLGFACQKLGERQRAAQSFEKALVIQPDRTIATALAQVRQVSAVKTRTVSPYEDSLASAYALQHEGRNREAAAAFSQAIQLKPTAPALLALAQSEEKLGNTAAAIAAQEHALKLGAGPEQQLALGLLLMKAGREREASQQLLGAYEALPEGPKRNTAARTLGFYYERHDRLASARTFFDRATVGAKDPHILMALAQIEARDGKPELAIEYLQTAIARPDDLSRADQIILYRSLGNLLSSTHHYRNAISAFETALALDYQAETALQLAVTLNKAGHTREALAILEGIPDKALSPEQQQTRQDQLAFLYWEMHEPEPAIRLMRQSVVSQPTAERQHRLGSWLRQTGEAEAALPLLEAALLQAPANQAYADEVAYAYLDNDDPESAIPLLEDARRRHPKRPGLTEDLAYAYMRASDNDKATQLFMEAIDTKAATTATSEQEKAALDESSWRLKNEVSKLTNQFDFTAYESYRSNYRNRPLSAGGITGGAIPSQGGVQLAYQPPFLGLRDEKTLQIFGRVLWSNKPESLSLDDTTLQAGFGLRYKPLRDQNLYISAEKLFKIGDQALDDWLLRSLFGWSSAQLMPPGETDWNYSSVFGDLGYFINSDTWAFYGEIRQGWTFRITEWMQITPHVVMDGRIQTRDVNDITYLEGGGGVLLKFLFNDTPYETYNNQIDLLLQYKAGIINTDAGFVATTILHF